MRECVIYFLIAKSSFFQTKQKDNILFSLILNFDLLTLPTIKLSKLKFRHSSLQNPNKLSNHLLHISLLKLKPLYKIFCSQFSRQKQSTETWTHTHTSTWQNQQLRKERKMIFRNGTKVTVLVVSEQSADLSAITTTTTGTQHWPLTKSQWQQTKHKK